MLHRVVAAATIFCLLATSVAKSDLIITMEPVNASALPAAPGAEVEVRLLLSVDNDDNPLEDVRLVQFAFDDSDDTLEIDGFSWSIDTSLYLEFASNNRPQFSLTTVQTSSNPGLVMLDDSPLEIARVTVVATGTGSLDPGFTSGAQFQARFDAPVLFSGASGNLAGQELVIEVDDDAPPPGTVDTDGDGVSDEDDAFPTDPDESMDTDDDGVGDNTDAFPEDENETTDTDEDGVGNNADDDDDGDNVLDQVDEFPLDPEESADTDSDGVGDNADAFPEDPEETADTDGDGVGDNGDLFPNDPDQSDLNEGNSNSGPRTTGGLCGLGIITPIACLLIGLLFARGSRARRWRRGTVHPGAIQ